MLSFTKPRWLKTANERLDEALLYIFQNLSAANSAEVMQSTIALTSAQQKALGESLSLGSTGSSRQRTIERKERNAKRALLLVTTLFLENIAYRRAELERIKALPENVEGTFLDEINSWFTIPHVTPSMVADKAVAQIAHMPNWQNVNINPSLIVRGKYVKGVLHEFNCYNAVVFWAFQAGAISRRFIWNKIHGKDGNAFFPIFSACGWSTDIEYSYPGAGRPPLEVKHDFKDTDNWIIPKGMAVYYVTPHKLFGHVALSLGDGKIISQNAVIPANGGAVLPEYRNAVDQMNRAITHIISIKHFWDIHYNPANGYNKLQHTTTAFWLAHPLRER